LKEYSISKKSLLAGIFITLVFSLTLYIDIFYYFFDLKIIDLKFTNVVFDLIIDVLGLIIGFYLLIQSKQTIHYALLDGDKA